MTQPVMFDEQGTPTPEAHASGAAAACSAEAFDKVDANRLRRLVEAEYKLFPDGATRCRPGAADGGPNAARSGAQSGARDGA